MNELNEHPKGIIPPSVIPAVVVSVIDSKKAGRVQVRIPQYHGAEDNDGRVPDDKLPWARPIFPIAGGGGGLFGVPQVGSAIAVMFFGGDYESIFWVGGFIGKNDLPSEFSDGYEGGIPKTYVLKTAGGHKIELREKDSDAQIIIETKEGNSLTLDDTNSLVELKTAGGNKVTFNDNDGSISIEATGKVEVKAPEVTLGPTGDDPVVTESKMLLAFNAHIHNDSTASPTTTPIPPLVTGSIGSQTVKASP